jgi:hypothetical protein
VHQLDVRMSSTDEDQAEPTPPSNGVGHGMRKSRPEPDDERAKEGVNYILAGLVALPMLAFGLGAIVVPPAVMITLIAKGLSRGIAGYVVAGSILGALWLLMLYGFTKSLFKKPKEKPGRPPGA